MRQDLLIKLRTHRYIYQFCSVCVCGVPYVFFLELELQVGHQAHLAFTWVLEIWVHSMHASFLHSKHLATEPFLLLPKFIFNWKYLLIEIHCSNPAIIWRWLYRFLFPWYILVGRQVNMQMDKLSLDVGWEAHNRAGTLRSDSVREEVELCPESCLLGDSRSCQLAININYTPDLFRALLLDE